MWASLQAGCLPFQLRCEIGTRGPGVDRYALRERPAYSAYNSTLSARCSQGTEHTLDKFLKIYANSDDESDEQLATRSAARSQQVVNYFDIKEYFEESLRFGASRDAVLGSRTRWTWRNAFITIATQASNDACQSLI